MATFTTRARVKNLLGIPSGVTFHDAKVDAVVAGVDRQILAWIGLPYLTQQTYSEKFDVEGPGEQEVALTYRPVASVAALTDDGSLLAASDYYVKTRVGHVVLTGSAAYFTQGRQKVEVTYTAGYESVPDDLMSAGDILAVALCNAGPHAGLQSEGESGGYHYQARSIHDQAVPPEVRAIIGGYRRLFAR